VSAWRVASGIALAIMVVVGAWWLAAVSGLAAYGDGGSAANGATKALWLLRGIAVTILAFRLGALLPLRQAVVAGGIVIAGSWPLLVLLWAAGAMTAGTALRLEAALALIAVAAASCAGALARWLGRTAAVPVATASGGCLAALLLSRSWPDLSWLGWLP
jgi:hypothetical protein